MSWRIARILTKEPSLRTLSVQILAIGVYHLHLGNGSVALSPTVETATSDAHVTRVIPRQRSAPTLTTAYSRDISKSMQVPIPMISKHRDQTNYEYLQLPSQRDSVNRLKHSISLFCRASPKPCCIPSPHHAFRDRTDPEVGHTRQVSLCFFCPFMQLCFISGLRNHDRTQLT